MSNGILINWKQINQLTLDFLEALPENLYHKKPFETRFKSFAWEFSCILSTREMYLNGFNSGQLNEETFNAAEEDLEKLAQSEIKKRLGETNKKVINLINAGNIKEINFWGEVTSKDQVISWLMQHEQLHFGKLMLYFSKAEIPLPKSLLLMWGEGSFKSH